MLFSGAVNLILKLFLTLHINIVTDLLKALLGNRPVNTYHSHECATIRSLLLGNAWVDMPDNSTWYPLWAVDVFFVGGPCWAYIRSSSVVQWVSSW
jgi:hypothetical protein